MTKTLQTVLSGYKSRDPTFCDPYRTHSLVFAGDRILHKLENGEEHIPDEITAAAGTEHIWIEQVCDAISISTGHFSDNWKPLGEICEAFAMIVDQIRPDRKIFNVSLKIIIDIVSLY